MPNFVPNIVDLIQSELSLIEGYSELMLAAPNLADNLRGELETVHRSAETLRKLAPFLVTTVDDGNVATAFSN